MSTWALLVCVCQVYGFSCICPSGLKGENCGEAMDPCFAFPCENGGRCVVGDDYKSSCLCPLGYDGIYCERNVDDCLPNPCLNDGVCIDGMNEFTCQCPIGYSGNVCNETIYFCLTNLCDHFGTKKCYDEIKGYTCECRHGFLGQYCDTVSSMNFDMVFVANQFVLLRGVPREDVQSFTFSLWLRTTINDSVILTHGLDSGNQRTSGSLILESPHDLTVIIQGISFDTGVSVNDDSWHHIAMTFDHTTSLFHLFVDGSVVITQVVPITSDVIPTNGVFVLGSSEETGVDDEQFKEQFSGRISGINLWNEVMAPYTVMAYAKSCFVHVPGNVIGMEDFLEGSLGGIWIEEPSSCDATNDCAKSPCANGGDCIDGYHEFICLCPNGLSGSTCEVNFDDCSVNVCENNGTCVDGLHTFTCQCMKGFTGTFCEIELVDGGWSDWSPWTSCSKSCDGGTQNRMRECNNPEPENGGASCGTDDSETRECNAGPCPVCKKFVRPKHGYSRCRTASNGETSCSIYCYLGYSFSITPLDEYKCGNSTNYIWTHESRTNPHLNVPSCTKLTAPRGIQVQVKTTYKNLQCSLMNASDVNEVNNHITQTATTISQQEGCVQTKECQLVDLRTSGCDSQASKRDVTLRLNRSNTSNVTVSMTFFQAVNVSSDNFTSNDAMMAQKKEAILNLRNLKTILANLVQDGPYIISSGGQLYDAVFDEDIEEIVCAEGEIHQENEAMCLPCAAGTFQTENYCAPCEEGFFQPDEGQSSCLSCPEGKVSRVIGAVSVEECDPEEFAQHESLQNSL